MLPHQGFSVSNVTESYDAKIFAASTLLSSLLVYNSMHVLHASELEFLDLLVHNTQLMSIKTAQNEKSLSPPAATLTDLIRLPPLVVTVSPEPKLLLNGCLGGGLAGVADRTAEAAHAQIL